MAQHRVDPEGTYRGPIKTRLGGNVAAAGVQLTPEDLAHVERALSAITIQGDRYPEHLQQLIKRRRRPSSL
jgi:hypothetical protein